MADNSSQKDLKESSPSTPEPTTDSLPENAPPESSKKARYLTFVESREHFAGPLPPPGVLAGYEQVFPGAAERIIRMAEQQLEHSHSLEQQIVGAEIRHEFRGMHLAFLLVTLICCGGVYLLAQGNDISGYVALLTPLATIAGVFIYSQHQKRAKTPSSSEQEQG